MNNCNKKNKKYWLYKILLFELEDMIKLYEPGGIDGLIKIIWVSFEDLKFRGTVPKYRSAL